MNAVEQLLYDEITHFIDRLATSGNSKIVLLPADLQDTLRGIFSKGRAS